MQIEEFENEDDDFKNFLQQVTISKKNDETKATNQDERMLIKPEAGFCLKTKRLINENQQEKVFINVCTSTQIGAPRQITEEELIEIVKAEDPGRFRVPISLGEPIADLDKNGDGCSIFTVIIHPDFYSRAQSNKTFMSFLLTLVYEGLQNKYPQYQLDTDWTKLKHRKYMGQLTEQTIRVRPKPFIVEVDENKPSETSVEKIRSSIETSENVERDFLGTTPEFKIIREPIEGEVEFLIMDVQLPKVKSAKTLTLELNSDHLILSTRSNIYHLDIWLPIEIDSDQTGAQFDRATQILTITMPVFNSRSM